MLLRLLTIVQLVTCYMEPRVANNHIMLSMDIVQSVL